MNSSRCPLHRAVHHEFTRRDFLRGSTSLLAGSTLLSGCVSLWPQKIVTESIRPCGPASKYVPSIKAAFVRRKEDYGMRWPGAVYDGEAAREMYSNKMISTAKKYGARFDIRGEPIYSLAEAESWIA